MIRVSILSPPWSQARLGPLTIHASALIGAAAMIGAAMQTPLAALALVIELTRTADTLIVPMVIGATLAPR